MSPPPFDSIALWQRAASFAARKHAGQTRQDDRTPYFAHPVRVALTVQLVFGCDDPVAICTALLHDTIEDTLTDYDDIREHFGDRIAECVARVTKDKRLPEETREPDFYEQIAAGPWQARVVKLADAYDNVTDAPTSVMRQQAVSKARLAIQVAGSEPAVVGAIEKLEALLTGFADA